MLKSFCKNLGKNFNIVRIGSIYTSTNVISCMPHCLHLAQLVTSKFKKTETECVL